MWKDFLSSIGIGSVKVDTIIPKSEVKPGELIEGEVVINGGQAEEPISKVTLQLLLRYEEVREDSDFSYHDKEIKEVVLDVHRNIEVDEEKRLPFQMELPKDHPLTDEENQTFLRTIVDIKQSVDPTDEDEIVVR
ncbi:sporulation protein [Bacillus ectoiniformans]|uniref:sporulation protein n=1 Tax=Bacillus ectoiniformans TaxID=1494429 RepID=UPI00195E596D|nr:sporulation protein [Bacillus ectoiniformans]